MTSIHVAERQLIEAMCAWYLAHPALVRFVAPRAVVQACIKLLFPM